MRADLARMKTLVLWKCFYSIDQEALANYLSVGVSVLIKT